jgi:hypothetical protein
MLKKESEIYGQKEKMQKDNSNIPPDEKTIENVENDEEQLKKTQRHSNSSLSDSQTLVQHPKVSTMN